jgi:uncharacterized membrane protein YbaN (DUF454 family)
LSAPQPPAPLVVAGWKRPLYQGLGLLMVGLGVLGAVLPILPTTPFMLAASFFFVRSSPALHRRLVRSPLFGPMVRDWEQYRGVRRSAKATAVVLIAAVIGASLAFAQLSPLLQGLLIGLGAVGLVVVLRLPAVRPEPAPELVPERVPVE